MSKRRPTQSAGTPLLLSPRLDIRDRPRDGPNAVAKAVWRDPEDSNPNARAAREIRGWRTFCPLRATLKRHGAASAITERHVFAADKLRLACDLAFYGGTAGVMWEAAGRPGFGPSFGPGELAVARLAASREVARARRLFSPNEAAMLGTIVLGNRSVSAWCRIVLGHDGPEQRRRAMARLVNLLDRLEAHYASEIDADLKRGRLLPAV